MAPVSARELSNVCFSAQGMLWLDAIQLDNASSVDGLLFLRMTSWNGSKRFNAIVLHLATRVEKVTCCF